MNIRESLEELEEQYMSPYASLSSRTRGLSLIHILSNKIAVQ